MRRILSIALAVLMLLSVATVGVFTVSAETGTDADANAVAINDATDFAMMDGNGSYYLAADITVDTTYNKSFTGTFDGRGHKITTSAPLFAQVSEATLKNLVIDGEYTDTATAADYIGMLAKVAENTVIDGVVSNVKVTATASNIAGIVGYVRGGTDTFIVMTNCVNNGAISSNTGWAGGLIAGSDADKTVIENCVNNGEVKSVKADGVTTATTAAGIVAVVTSSDGVFELVNCINNANVTGHRPGGILGCAEALRQGSFERCVNNGDILSTTNYAGGITCRIDAKSPITYRACVNTGDVTIFQSQAGGMIGYSGNADSATGWHNFYGCVNTGKITGLNVDTTDKSINVGGLAGAISGKTEFHSCVNLGEVIGNASAGGIIGRTGLGAGDLAGRGGSIVDNCYVGGSVYSYGYKSGNTTSVGGLAGYCWGDFHTYNNVITADVKFDCTTEKDQANKIVVAGICGYTNNGGGRYENNYILGKVTGTAECPAVEIANFKTHNWDTKNIHLITGCYSVNGLPKIWADAIGASPYTLPKPNMEELDTDAEIVALLNKLVGAEVWTLVTEGELTGILPVSVVNAPVANAEAVAVGTAEEFLAMSATGNYYLTADITLDKSYASAFTGKLDGKGYTITTTAPVFELLVDATVTDLKIAGDIEKENTTLAATRTFADYVGALASVSVNSDVAKITNNANVSGFEAVGGIVGRSVGGSFTDCVNNGVVKGNSATGGILGWNIDLDVTITNCVNNGVIDRYNFNMANTGGIVGRIDFCDATIDNCVNTVTLEMPYGSHRAGGILGYFWDTYRKQNGTSGDTDRAYLSGYLTVTNCTNLGSIKAYDQVAGIIGWCEGSLYMENCVNNGNITSIQNYAGGLVGRAGSNNGQTSTIPHEFVNCVNTGDVQAHRQYIGGILGYTQENVIFRNCINLGDVTGEKSEFGGTCADNGCHTGTSAHFFSAGGILGRSNYDGKFYNCVNAGDITGNHKIGGIAGEVDCNFAKGYDGKIVFENCLNTGDVYNTNKHITANLAKNNGTGGIAGTVFSDSSVAANTVTFKNCGSTGTVTAEVFATDPTIPSVAGIGGYVDTPALTVEGCYFVGKLVCSNAMANTTGTVFATASTYAAASFKNNAFLSSQTVLYRDAVGPNVLANDYAGYVVSADVASGKLCYLLNEMIGSTVYYQQIGVDVAPTPVKGDVEWIVYFDEATGTYTNALAEEETTTEAPVETTTEPVVETTTEPDAETTTEPVVETTTEPEVETTTEPEAVTTEKPEDVTTAGGDDTTEPDGGCGSVIGASIAIVAMAIVAPAALMLKKKED